MGENKGGSVLADLCLVKNEIFHVSQSHTMNITVTPDMRVRKMHENYSMALRIIRWKNELH